MNNKFDKAMDILATAGVAVPMFVTGLPGWVVSLCGVVTLVASRAAGKGIPIVSSFAPGKKDSRGQVTDAEDPK
jgi:hypothetical protein